jgi:hypothetical protein
MLNGFRLHRGVHHDHSHLFLRDRLRSQPRFDRQLQQSLHTFCSDALPPSRNLRKVHRQLVLKELLAAEDLPVRALESTPPPVPMREYPT